MIKESGNFSDRIFFLFQKYINNECSNEELEELLNTLKNSSVDEQVDIVTESLWEAIKKKESSHISKNERQQLQSEVQMLVNKAENRKRTYRVGQRKIYQRVAAAILVLIIGGASFWIKDRKQINNHFYTEQSIERKSFQTIETEKKTIQLPDGSEVIINGGSNLKFIEGEFNKDQREVWLEGEAFFEVKKDPLRPFIIHTSDIKTIVRGTSFNIKAYSELGENVVSVKTGKVEIHGNNKLLATLTPDEQLNYKLGDKTIDVKDTSWDDACGWINNRLVLNKANVVEMKLRIRQSFGKEVIVKNGVLNDMLITSSFERGTSLKQVVNIISAMYGLQYQITDSQVILYNTHKNH